MNQKHPGRRQWAKAADFMAAGKQREGWKEPERKKPGPGIIPKVMAP